MTKLRKISLVILCWFVYLLLIYAGYYLTAVVLFGISVLCLGAYKEEKEKEDALNLDTPKTEGAPIIKGCWGSKLKYPSHIKTEIHEEQKR